MARGFWERRWPDRALLALLCLAQAAATWTLLRRSLWLDEAYSAILARRPWPELLAALAHDNNPFLHYLLLRGWRAVFGESELALRSLSLAFALGSTLLLHRLARRTFGAATARLATALWALNPLALFYAAEARTYMLLAFAGLALLSAVWEPAAPPGRWRWALLAVSFPALVYAHNTGWFVAAAALGAALVVNPAGVLRWPMLASLGAGALAYVPWIPWLVRQLEVAELSSGWLRFFWSPWNPVFGLSAFTPFGRGAAFVPLPAAPAAWWVAVLVVWVAPIAWLLVRGGPEGVASGRFLSLHVGLALLLLVLASVALRPVYLPGRHDFVLLAPFLLLVAAGTSSLPARLGRVSAGVLLAVTLAGAVALHQRPIPPGDRAWAQAVGGRARAGDVVLCAGLTRPQSEYYLAGRDLTFVSFPSAMEVQLAHLDLGWRAAALREDAAVVVERAVRALPPAGSLWVIDAPTTEHRVLRAVLAGRADLAGERAAPGSFSLERLGATVRLVRYRRTHDP